MRKLLVFGAVAAAAVVATGVAFAELDGWRGRDGRGMGYGMHERMEGMRDMRERWRDDDRGGRRGWRDDDRGGRHGMHGRRDDDDDRRGGMRGWRDDDRGERRGRWDDDDRGGRHGMHGRRDDDDRRGRMGGGMHGGMMGMHGHMGGRHGMMDGGRRGPMGGMGFGPGAAFDAADVGELKRELRITAAQEDAWTKYAKVLQDTATAVRTARESIDRDAATRSTPQERYAQRNKLREQVEAQHAALTGAAKELLGALDDTQKEIAEDTLPGLVTFGPGLRGAGMGRHRH